MKANDLYKEVTDSIIATLESGTRPWMKPWQDGQASNLPLRVNSVPYRGVNILLLWAAACAKGYQNAYWMTYKAAAEMGAQVRKGEKSTHVVVTSTFNKPDAEDPDKKNTIPFYKVYSVFNADQIDGLPEKYYLSAMPKEMVPVSERVQEAINFFANTKAVVVEHPSRACYIPGKDQIQMPPWEAFVSPESYVATHAHELIHWTKHKSRLDRDYGAVRWGDEGYAREELVAELGSAFLCAYLRVTPEVQPEHAAYIESWLKSLKGDTKYIFKAASAAQKATEYLQAFSTPVQAEDEQEAA